MGDLDGRGTPEPVIDGPDKGRYVESKKSKFSVDDKVKLSKAGAWHGPYVIESVPSTGRYTLCLSDGTSVEDGREVEEAELEAYEGV